MSEKLWRTTKGYSLDEDRQRRYDETAKVLEEKLNDGDVKGAFSEAQKWYRKRSKASKPTYHDEESTRKEFEELRKAVGPRRDDSNIYQPETDGE
jgi:hypothetical protein